MALVLFLPASALGSSPIVVTNTSDSGTGSLRQAISDANAAAGLPSTIVFDIPTSDPGYNVSGGWFTIAPLSPLPALLAGGTTIDGSTQTAATGDTNTSGPEIELNGSLAPPDTHGLDIPSSNNRVNGLVIDGFTGSDGLGINILGGSDNVVTGSYLGLDPTGSSARANGHSGIRIGNGTGNLVGGTSPADRNVISGNGFNGVELQSNGNVVEGNFVGTDESGTKAVGNATDGVSEVIGAQQNTVGGSSAGAGNLISGNGADGIFIGGNGQATIAGNQIGTDVTGTSALANLRDGIEIVSDPGHAADGNTITSNVIADNAMDGINLSSNGNVIQGNQVDGNGGSGVNILTLAANTLIGGTSAAARNVISGNTHFGVNLGSGVTGALIEGDYIGTNAAGTAAFGNGSDGIRVGGAVGAASGITIGGTSPGAGNLISGNGVVGPAGSGIGFLNGVNGVTVEGNLIGTDVNGTYEIANAMSGVRFYQGNVANTVIGGTKSAARNVIENGIFVGGTGNSGNVIDGNFIGTNAAGTAALTTHGGDGIALNGSSDTLIGGTAPGAGNVISGNAPFGVVIAGSSGTTVQGNSIGTDATGLDAIGNAQGGISITGPGTDTNTLIGGTASGAGNVISGNSGSGVGITPLGVGTVVQGNLIGTDATGTHALANIGIGVSVAGAKSLIGGTASGAGNVISGNGSNGVSISASGETVQGNFIGTDPTGTVIGNGSGGVSLCCSSSTQANQIIGNQIVGSAGPGIAIPGASNNVIQGNQIETNKLVGIDDRGNGNVIGGSGAGEGNVVSGNGRGGIGVSVGAGDTTIQGNLIGTDATGNAALANRLGSGIGILGAPNTLIGGTTPGAGNVISGNAQNGIQIAGSGNAVIEGNLIGTNAAGTTAIPNGITPGFAGVSLSTTGNVVEANTIAYSSGSGVDVLDGTSNRISRNSIFSNGGLGIDLGGDGVTPNDPGDTDTGPNNLQNFPVLTSALLSPSALVVQGTIDTPNPETVVLEFFANPVPVPGGDPSGYGEGAVFLGTATPAPDGTFTAVLPRVAPGTLISATATDAAGNTSEFAKDIAPLPTSADQCKDGGWQAYGVFKNQGDCVSFVATKGTNPPG